MRLAQSLFSFQDFAGLGSSDESLPFEHRLDAGDSENDDAAADATSGADVGSD